MIYQDGDGTWEPFTNKQQRAKALTLDVLLFKSNCVFLLNGVNIAKTKK